MKKLLSILLIFAFGLAACGTGTKESAPVESKPAGEDPPAADETTLSVDRIQGLSPEFMMGVDISSLLSLEASGRIFYGFDGQPQDIFKTLSDAGVNYIRVRVWNDPFDENGNGYGGGNCTVDTAIELGLRAKEYGMGLLVDFHYSDFWADPGKQQAPKAWEGMTLDEKADAIYQFTVQSITQMQQSGVQIGMVQVGNETTGGFCGESDKAAMYRLMGAAARAVRDTDGDILVAVHYTNPERKAYLEHAEDLARYGVEYDVFTTSYYPEYHGTMRNLTEQLQSVHNFSGKQVMIAETSWAHTSSQLGPYKRSVQGQADEIADCIQAMAELGDYAIGVFYWEPAWIDVPGESWDQIHAKRELYGAGWASSYAGSYDPKDAGKYYGGTACIPTALFDADGYPLESLKTFRCVRSGTHTTPKNLIADPSFESGELTIWKIREAEAGTVSIQTNPDDARQGSGSLHFWSGNAVSFKTEQTLEQLPEGLYSYSLYVQGDGAGENAVLRIYAVSGAVRYEQSFTLDGWLCWKAPAIMDIPCTDGVITVGIEVNAAPGAWGTIDQVELLLQEDGKMSTGS